MSVLVDVDFTGDAPRISIDTTAVDKRIAELEAENKRLRGVAEEALRMIEHLSATRKPVSLPAPASAAPVLTEHGPGLTAFGPNGSTSEPWRPRKCRLLWAERAGK
jgi:hypothetical protein